jgi:hypothetical protein
VSAPAGLRADQLLGAVVRRSVPWAGGAGVLCVLTFATLAGPAAGLAALLGLLMVVLFFGVDLVVLRLTRRAHGAVTAAALMGEYALKVVLLAAALWALATSTDLDLQPTAVTVVVTTVVGAIAVTAVAMRVRSFTFDFPADQSSKGR